MTERIPEGDPRVTAAGTGGSGMTKLGSILDVPLRDCTCGDAEECDCPFERDIAEPKGIGDDDGYC